MYSILCVLFFTVTKSRTSPKIPPQSIFNLYCHPLGEDAGDICCDVIKCMKRGATLITFAHTTTCAFPHCTIRLMHVCLTGSPNPLVVPGQSSEPALSQLAQTLLGGLGSLGKALAPGVYQYNFNVPGKHFLAC